MGTFWSRWKHFGHDEAFLAIAIDTSPQGRKKAENKANGKITVFLYSGQPPQKSFTTSAISSLKKQYGFMRLEE